MVTKSYNIYKIGLKELIKTCKKGRITREISPGGKIA